MMPFDASAQKRKLTQPAKLPAGNKKRKKTNEQTSSTVVQILPLDQRSIL